MPDACLIAFNWHDLHERYAIRYEYGTHQAILDFKEAIDGDYDVIYIFVRPTTPEDIDRQFVAVDAMMQAMQKHFGGTTDA